MSGQRVFGAVFMFLLLGGLGYGFGGEPFAFIGAVTGLILGLAISPGEKKPPPAG